MRSGLVVSIAVVASALGCGKDRTELPISSGPLLLAPGSEPRGIVRYRLSPGTSTKITLALDATLHAGDDARLPTFVVDAEVRAEAAIGDGRTRVRVTCLGVSTRERDGTAVTAAQLATHSAALRDLTFTGTLAPDGRLGDLALGTKVETLPPALREQIRALSRSFAQLATPLPHEPIGVGARWQDRRTIDQQGMQLIVVTTFAATAIEADQLTFTSTTAISGPDQRVSQAGTTIEISQIAGEGVGHGIIDLTRMTMTGELTASFHSEMASPGERTQMGMTLATRVGPGSATATDEATAPLDATTPPADATAPLSPADAATDQGAHGAP